MKSWPAGGLRLTEELDRNWFWWTLFAWGVTVAWFLYFRWGNIQGLSLGDTDDNMRLMQVRALLAGQDWYDLRQYRLDPALGGIDIHWSRLVDLPIAGLILLFKPFVGMAQAERLACGIAPLLPLAIAMTGLALTVRRLIAPWAWPLALAGLVFACTSSIMQFAPMRIDHHGWQLACLAMTVPGLADPRRARGGAAIGLFSAISLTIGLELLPYCVMAGAIVALRWIWDAGDARRMQVYALTLSGGCALGFVVFASNANQAMRCDALTPVWLSTMVAVGLMLFLLSLAPTQSRVTRLVLAGIAGVAIAAAFALLFPQCLGRPEGVSDELANTWLNNVREARPIWRHPIRSGFPMVVLPIIGLIGVAVATWRAWRNDALLGWAGEALVDDREVARLRARRTDKMVGWAAIALFTAFSGSMLLWQVRIAPAAQMMSIPGVVALLWIIVPWCLKSGSILVRVLGTFAAVMVVSGLFSAYVIRWFPVDKPNPGSARVNRANAQCSSPRGMATLNVIPPSILFTHVDMGPRLIVMTKHSGIAGPYHRNERQILDVHRAFDGPTARFRAIAAPHKAQYLLVCPNLAETTIYRSRNPKGFYAELHRGKVPDWLEPVPLAKGSPLRLWKIRYDLPEASVPLSPRPPAKP